MPAPSRYKCSLCFFHHAKWTDYVRFVSDHAFISAEDKPAGFPTEQVSSMSPLPYFSVTFYVLLLRVRPNGPSVPCIILMAMGFFLLIELLLITPYSGRNSFIESQSFYVFVGQFLFELQLATFLLVYVCVCVCPNPFVAHTSVTVDCAIMNSYRIGRCDLQNTTHRARFWLA